MTQTHVIRRGSMSALSHRIGRASAPHSTGMPVLDAQNDFLRARRAYMAAHIAGWITRQTNGSRPLTLTDAAVPSAAPPRLEVVPISRIVGTLEPTSHFDAHFRPASEVVRHRWQRIALAHRTGVPLPPISLAKRSSQYYVIDGRHRVSVARALGDPDINAWVTDLTELPSLLESPRRTSGMSEPSARNVRTYPTMNTSLESRRAPT